MTWVPVNAQISVKQTFAVHKSELELQDKYINLDDVTALTDEAMFSLKEGPQTIKGLVEADSDLPAMLVAF